MEFGELRPDGTYIRVAMLPQSAILGCPARIMVPEHYASDGTCYCHDPTHTEMRGWGYRWNRKRSQWIAQ